MTASLLCLSLTAVSFSAECLEPLSKRRPGKDPYGPLKISELTGRQHDDIRRLFKSLHGEWLGSATDRYCSLTDKNDRQVEEYTVKGRVTVDHFGNFFMKMDFYSTKKRTTHQKILRFYLSEKGLRINHDNGAGDVELMRVTENEIDLYYRTRIPNKLNPGGIHRAFFVFITVEENAFSIKREVFTQARLSSEHLWKFHPR